MIRFLQDQGCMMRINPWVSFKNTAIISMVLLVMLSAAGILQSASSESTGTHLGEIYSGSIPSGDGIVSVKAASGRLYQIPAMTPLGIIQALAGTDSIESYLIGDELIAKKGILTLDGINNLSGQGDWSWYVQVNNRQLQDYLVPTQEALNSYIVKTGDVLLFAYGNPTRPLSEAGATVKVSIGSRPEGVTPGAPGTVLPTIQVPPEPVLPVSAPSAVTPLIPVSSTVPPTVPPAPVITDIPLPVPSTVPPTLPPTPVMTESPVPVSGDQVSPAYEDQEQNSQDEGNDPNKPVYEDQEQNTKDEGNDPNKPVYEDQEQNTQDEGSDPNKPVYEDQEQNTKDEGNDPNKPVYEDGSEPADSGSDDDGTSEGTGGNDDEEPEDSSDGEEKPASSSRTSASGQEILFEGTFTLPSGTINVTADSGVEYDVSANTPIGLLQLLHNDNRVGTFVISDKGMNKGGILTISSIGDYYYGDEAWFVQVNNVGLKDYLNPDSDGLNIRMLQSGDSVTFYYGTMDQLPATAKAAIYVTIE